MRALRTPRFTWLLEKATRNASSNWEIAFVENMQAKHDEDGPDADLTAAQWNKLEEIADSNDRSWRD